jgi:hypothetical protein
MPHSLSDDQKVDREQQAPLLLVAVTAAEKRRRLNFWTGDEFWITWVNPSTGSWMIMNDELPQRVCQTIGATGSMLTVFFSPKEFVMVNILSQDTSFTGVYFVNNVILPLANWHA